MNCRPENYDDLLAFRMGVYLETNNRVGNRHKRVKARRKYFRLLRQHPHVADRNGFTKESAKSLATVDREWERLQKKFARLRIQMCRDTGEQDQRDVAGATDEKA